MIPSTLRTTATITRRRYEQLTLMEELENEDGCVETKYVRVHRRLGLILRNIHERDWGCKRVEVDEERSNHDER